MISDLLSTRPVGTNTSLTTKVASAVDQDKSESFTLLGLPVGLSAAPLPLEGALWTQNAEHTLERDVDTLSNQYFNSNLSDSVSFVPVVPVLSQPLLNTEINSAPIIQDGLAATPQASLVSPTAVAPFVPVIFPAETVKADPIGRTPASLIGLSVTDQRGILFSSGMTSSMALAGSRTQPAGMSGESLKMSGVFTQDSTLATFSGDFEHLKSDSSVFQRVLAELRGHEVKDINAIGSQQVAGTQAASATQWGPVSLTPMASLAQHSQEILTPLREHLRFQVDQYIKKAELRLDPPELGKIELNIRLEGDRLQVQMHAVNPAIRDALLNGLERLRVDLAMDHGGQIDVDIGQGESQQHQQETALFSSSIAAETATDNVADVMTREKSQLDLLA
ncbi:flagellar hook-length control protein FliK [Shewanella sp. NKUCC01_JLK]|uniref:flagellar hook-length control protein FliK n=1 Tax=unclassified Shewanella TaxID=196818 RepID=UPI001564CCA8|nr:MULTISPECIES: flagellar hook-length control protein FliK [unclassified Shewanella]MBW3517058.1 flagellar hook-length control protein FliK [Shewanella sp. NKUCC01_JLK]NRD33980.1 flagellar hook-length control protein FliK [Shewanella sp. DC2-4]